MRPSANASGESNDRAINAARNARVVAALSLRGDQVWQQLSNLVVEELAAYVQPPTFGVLRVVVPAGRFTGGEFCSVHGDEVYFADDSRRCLAVYRDDVLQRRIGEGEVAAQGSAVVGDAVFVADYREHAVCVYPRVGGARLQRFGARGGRLGDLRFPRGIAACGGRVYVGEKYHVSVFTEDGAFCKHFGEGSNQAGWFAAARGVAVDADQIFVAGEACYVRVFDVDDPDHVSCRIGGGYLRQPHDVCVSGGVLFVSDWSARRVVAIDIGNGYRVAILAIADGRPRGVAVRADGTLFVTVTNDATSASQLLAAPLL